MQTVKIVRSRSWYLLMTIVIFCYIYQFRLSIIGLPIWLHSIRMAALIIYIVYFASLKEKFTSIKISGGIEKRFYKRLWYLHAIIFIYMIILYLTIGITEGDHMVVFLLNFYVITMVPIYMCSKLFNSWDEFFVVILAATLLQTIIIWITTLNPEVATYVDILFNNNAEVFSLNRIGYTGGLGCITAPGYIRYSLGQIACFYFIIEKKHKIPFFLLYVFMLLTGAMIARTGLFAGTIGLILILMYLIVRKSSKSIISVMIVTIIVIYGAGQILNDAKISLFFTDRFKRMIELSEESQEKGFFESRYFFNYLHSDQNYLPPITAETIIGTGVPSGTAGNGVRVNIDGGYLRLYVAYGLVLALFFYYFVIRSMFKISFSGKNQEEKYTLLFTTLMFLLAEYKEWSFYGSPYIWFFCVLALIFSDKKSNIIKKLINK